MPSYLVAEPDVDLLQHGLVVRILELDRLALAVVVELVYGALRDVSAAGITSPRKGAVGTAFCVTLEFVEILVFGEVVVVVHDALVQLVVLAVLRFAVGPHLGLAADFDVVADRSAVARVGGERKLDVSIRHKYERGETLRVHDIAHPRLGGISRNRENIAHDGSRQTRLIMGKGGNRYRRCAVNIGPLVADLIPGCSDFYVV